MPWTGRAGMSWACGLLWAVALWGGAAMAEEASGIVVFPGAAAPQAAGQVIAAAAAVKPERFSFHAQFTTVVQYHPGFRSSYQGANSLDAGNGGRETIDLTLFAGARLWPGGAFYVNPEVDQGFGLSNTLGVAGFPSGEAYKVGKSDPYLRLHRAFFRQMIGLGEPAETVESDANRLAGPQPGAGLTLTAGKFSAVDIFDTNAYAHDPRNDFLNWSIIDAGAYDYAADAWGYSYGAAAEWTRSWWTLRAGVFDLSRVPNSERLERGFGQFEAVGELEARHTLDGHPGKLKLLGYVNRGRMADYRDALRLAQQTASVPDVANVRRYRSRPGAALNLEQEVASDLGVFVRASLNDGGKEAYEFTEINRSLAAGLALKGARWNRPEDTVGLAGVVNGLSGAARDYFAAGGLGILIGDGRLPHYGPEKIVEVYYAARTIGPLSLGLDYQYIVNPAYNRDRGPVSVFGLRLHAEM
ncbi:MAG: carbohydrate porin [Sinobacteraceae bacterium]|nr:carbohydrate porin [Nevskiaceae bacterium]